MQYCNDYQSPLGSILLASNGTAITGLWFTDQKYYGSTLEPDAVTQELPIFTQTKKWLNLYFQGIDPKPAIPIIPQGTNFQMQVWNLLKKIPYGTVMTYKEIAQAIAKQNGIAHMSAQAVGGAVGRNPISILIPCHRVVGTNGSLTGYAGGLDKKIHLLHLEGYHIID